MKLVIPSVLKAARQAEEDLLAEVARHGYGEQALFAIRLALEEGLNNAVTHGNRCDPAKTVEVLLKVDPDRVDIEIADQGGGFDPHDIPDPTADENLEKPSGRGIMLMRAFMDEVAYSKRGTRLHLVKTNA